MNGIRYWLSVAAFFAALLLVVSLNTIAFVLSIPARLLGLATIAAQKWLDSLTSPRRA